MTEQRFATGGTQMVAAGHHLAAEAAHQVLEEGGNAADAGIAGGMAVSVLLSEHVHFGGVAPIMFRNAETGRVKTVTGLGTWPALASIDYFRNTHNGAIPKGVARTVVPGAPDAWLTALRLFGTKTFAEVARFAIDFARNGFEVTAHSAAVYKTAEKSYLAFPENRRIFFPDGHAPEAGTRIFLTELAATLQHMCDEEAAAPGSREDGILAARRAFYEGDIAATIDRYYREHDGFLRREDLAGFAVDVEDAVPVQAFGFTLYGCGPWSQGPFILETLKILDAAGYADLDPDGAESHHLLVEAMKLGFADRHHYVGDPKFVDVPLAGLLADDYARDRARAIDLERAYPDMPPPGKPRDFVGAGATIPAPAGTYRETELDTSYIAVIDKAGHVFGATPSDGTGQTPIIPGLGMCCSPRGSQSWTDPDHPSALAPGKRPRLTPNPAIAYSPDGFIMPFGSPGNDVQSQAMLQILLAHKVHGIPLDAAMQRPRLGTVSFPRSSEPHDYYPNRLNVEEDMNGAALAGLKARGHDIHKWTSKHWLAGAVCTVHKDLKTGELTGASDPRRPTGVAGR